MTTLFSVIGKAALGLAWVVSLSGSAQGQDLAPASNGSYARASWLVTYRWDGGGTGNSVFTFTRTSPNGGTFVAGSLRGRYFQRPGDSRAVLAFETFTPAWSCVYSLTVARGGRRFSGIMGHTHSSGGQVGTHTAVRVRAAKDPGEYRNLLLEEADDVNAVGDAVKPADSK